MTLLQLRDFLFPCYYGFYFASFESLKSAHQLPFLYSLSGPISSETASLKDIPY
jgi:hypothetical protein